ncbi:unnamed protein product [Effrenium voratum]|nr:unnamed protein product [Effrenium voratum]
MICGRMWCLLLLACQLAWGGELRRESAFGRVQTSFTPVADESQLVDCSALTLSASCPITVNKQDCEQTIVEFHGIQYTCYFTERTYGSVSATIAANKCVLIRMTTGPLGEHDVGNIDMNSRVCKQIR